MTQQEALDVLKSGSNVFLTGSAGSGKTHVLNRFIDYLKLQNKVVGITASTGVAATHINGMTINAWSGIGIKTDLSLTALDELMQRKYLRERFTKTKVLIIDEVSMLSSKTLETVDTVLRAFRDNDDPFGGIQIVLCGDFFQLPPIGEIDKPMELIAGHKQFQMQQPLTQLENPNYIYKSELWQSLDIKVCYLEKPFRQVDDRFLQILDQIRNNNITRDIWDTLKDRFFQSFSNGISPTRLYTHNKHADSVNLQELAKLKDPEHVYFMKTRGNETLANVMKKNCLAPERLVIKKKALVMFVKNNAEEGYANGTMGRVIDFTEKEGYPLVRIFNGKEILVKPSEWTIEEEGETRATLQQIPLRLAWAITIHKSQGMSLDAAEIDLGKSFVTGMGYVALSRVRSLEGIRLRSLNKTALTVSNEVIQIDKKLRKMSEAVVQELRGNYYYKINNK
jgi:ATP-dependent exoDNAse (exonuclease V) alpha subunit